MDTLLPRVATLTLAALLATGASSQTFVPGDLYLFSPAVTGSSSADGGIVRIDPVTGNAALIVDLNQAQQWGDSMAFDPFRGGLVFHGLLTGSLDPKQLYLADALGGTQSLGHINQTFHALAPTGDGRIYLRDRSQPTGQVAYLDASNQLHTLLDEWGNQPFNFTAPGQFFQFIHMEYHAETASLIAAATVGGPSCTAGNSPSLTARRIALSADGSRAIGPVACTEVEVSTSGEWPVGMTRMDNGSLLLTIDTNSSAAEPRMMQLDPSTLTVTPFATNTYFGAGATNAGTWSTTLGKAVILDTFSDILRTYAAGESGDGALITPSIQISSAGGSGEIATLLQAIDASCSGSLTTYGAGLGGSGGYVPTLTATGCPAAGNTIHLHLAHGLGDANVALLVGLAPLSAPLLGGIVLVDPLFSVSFGLTGTPGVAGAGSLSIPITIPASFMPGDPNPYYFQGVILDPGAIQTLSMTGGLEVEIG